MKINNILNLASEYPWSVVYSFVDYWHYICLYFNSSFKNYSEALIWCLICWEELNLWYHLMSSYAIEKILYVNKNGWLIRNKWRIVGKRIFASNLLTKIEFWLIRDICLYSVGDMHLICEAVSFNNLRAVAFIRITSRNECGS